MWNMITYRNQPKSHIFLSLSLSLSDSTSMIDPSLKLCSTTSPSPSFSSVEFAFVAHLPDPVTAPEPCLLPQNPRKNRERQEAELCIPTPLYHPQRTRMSVPPAPSKMPRDNAQTLPRELWETVLSMLPFEQQHELSLIHISEPTRPY